VNVTPQHEGFKQRLEQSDEAVLRVATAFRNKGYTVQLPPLRVAPTAAEAPNYVDKGDMHAFKMRNLQIKQKLDCYFTGASDWPFPDVYVANVPSVDRAVDVYMYVIMSADLYHCVTIRADTKDHWTTKGVVCKNTGNLEDLYVCPLEHVVFTNLRDFPQ